MVFVCKGENCSTWAACGKAPAHMEKGGNQHLEVDLRGKLTFPQKNCLYKFKAPWLKPYCQRLFHRAPFSLGELNEGRKQK